MESTDWDPVPASGAQSTADIRPSKRRKLDSEVEPSRPARPTINDLPEELLDQVAQYLPDIGYHGHDPFVAGGEHPWKWGKKHLYQFSLVSRKFHRVATPLLYSAFAIDPRASALESNLHTLLATIMRNPDLAAHFRTAVVEEFEFDFEDENEDEDQNEDEDEDQNEDEDEDEDHVPRARDAVVERASQVKVFDSARFRIFLLAVLRARLNRSESLLSMLLVLTPNLKGLELRFGDSEDHNPYIYDWAFRLIQLAASGLWSGPQCPFRKLQHLIFRAPYGGNYNEQTLQSFMRLPSLRTLELQYVTGTWKGIPSWTELASNVDTLILEAVSFSNEFLVRVIRACRQVKVLALSFSEDRNEGNGRVDSNMIRRALLSHTDSLETLILEFYLLETHEISQELSVASAIGSLKKSHKLRHLRINGVFLFGLLDPNIAEFSPDDLQSLEMEKGPPSEEFFPESLESLSLNIPCTHATTVDGTFRLMADVERSRRAGFLPHLRFVELIVTRQLWLDEIWEENRNVRKKDRWQGRLYRTGKSLVKSGIEEFRVRITLKEAYSITKDLLEEAKGNGKDEVEWSPSIVNVRSLFSSFARDGLR